MNNQAQIRRRVLCTVAHGPHARLLDVTGPALQDYADRHGFELLVVDRPLAPSRPAAWGKIALLHSLVETPGLVFWVDADALVLGGAPDITTSLTRDGFLHLVEHRVDGNRVPNTGVMAVRGGPRASAFFERVWNDTSSVHHRWWENAAVIRLLGYRLEPPIRPIRWRSRCRGVGFLDNAWNSIPADASRQPHIVHYPGLPIDDRLAALRRAAALV